MATSKSNTEAPAADPFQAVPAPAGGRAVSAHDQLLRDKLTESNESGQHFRVNVSFVTQGESDDPEDARRVLRRAASGVGLGLSLADNKDGTVTFGGRPVNKRS